MRLGLSAPPRLAATPAAPSPRSAPSRPSATSLTRDRSPPAPSRIRTVLTDRSVTRADLAFAPKRPPPPQTASEPLAPSEVATTDLAPNARPVRLSASPHLPDLVKPTGHHQLVHRVLLHNRSAVVLLRTYSGYPEGPALRSLSLATGGRGACRPFPRPSDQPLRLRASLFPSFFSSFSFSFCASSPILLRQILREPPSVHSSCVAITLTV